MAGESNTSCPNPDCEKKFQSMISSIATETKGHDKTLYGNDGRGGIVKDIDDLKNQSQKVLDYFKGIFDNQEQPLFMKKISPAIWVPFILIIISAAITTGYNARNAASKEELKEIQIKQCQTEEDVTDIRKSVTEIHDKVEQTASSINKKMNETVKEIKQEVNAAMKEQKEDLRKENELYYKNLKQLIESFHYSNNYSNRNNSNDD